VSAVRVEVDLSNGPAIQLQLILLGDSHCREPF
jgi:hypothetical protein